MSSFNENSRVKIPAIVHLTRLGYGYLSIKDPDIKSQIDPTTNIFKQVFIDSLIKINSTNTPPHSVSSDDLVERINNIYQELANKQLDSYDCGKSFYEALINGIGDLKLIDFNNFNRNTFNVVTELPYASSGDEFRPDITILVNGMPLAFVEVKKPNNRDGIQAERERINQRFRNNHFNRFINLTQFMIFSNNMEYDDSELRPLQGAFYGTPAVGSKAKVYFNHFREQKPSETIEEIKSIDESVENFILNDNNIPIIKESPEYITNKHIDRPTNRIITSLLAKPRLKFILQYAFAFVNDSNGTPQRQIMRYPQFFATKAIANTLDRGIKKGVIWHTQGSGKTALAFYNVKYLTDYFARQNKVAKFYFIVDRLDLLNQASQEFAKRGLRVRTVNSKDELAREFSSVNSSSSGRNEICVINIQKFRDDTVATNASGYDDIRIQRIYFIDEAHRSYDPRGSYLANLYQSDRDSIKIALTGTPLIIYREHQPHDEYDDNLSDSLDRKTTVGIFGDYIHKYYYTDSIRDGYTLRLLREEVEASYHEQMANLASQIQVTSGQLKPADLYANKRYVDGLLRYIVTDLIGSRSRLEQPTIGGMIVCYNSHQAREVFRQLKANYPQVNSALILCDEGIKEERKQQIDDFKAGKIDILVVFNMLLTGFDAPHLKKLYLCRIIRAHNLLQALTRVNRPYNNMSMGYVVDFANIQSEFQTTNEHYLSELRREYQPGIDSSDGDVFGSLFVSREEIERRINNLRQCLSGYRIDNAEIFTTQISSSHDKKELTRLSIALNDARGLYNMIKLFGYDELLSKIDFNRINDEYREVLDRINLLNTKEAINDDTNSQAMLNEAVENVIFDFHKNGERELKLDELAGEAQTTTRQIREQLSVAADFDADDPEYVSLSQELRRLLSAVSISREQITTDDMYSTIRQLRDIYERAVKFNRANQRLADSYHGDRKFAVADKKLASEAREMPDYLRHNFLMDAKSRIDQDVLNNQDIVNSEGTLVRRVKQSVNLSATDAKVDLNHQTRVNIANGLSDMYIKQYEGDD